MVNPTNLNAEETEQVSEEVAEDSENDKDAKMKKCIKEAKTNKDKKNCTKQNQQTVEEFIEDEGLRLIEGFLKIYTIRKVVRFFLQNFLYLQRTYRTTNSLLRMLRTPHSYLE